MLTLLHYLFLFTQITLSLFLTFSFYPMLFWAEWPLQAPLRTALTFLALPVYLYYSQLTLALKNAEPTPLPYIGKAKGSRGKTPAISH